MGRGMCEGFVCVVEGLTIGGRCDVMDECVGEVSEC